jgi:biopolymer transport protein TolR|tara:strand:- start:172 stop:636 length:465 start_codon:yes stop_codon:yes gene_type:complete
MGGGITQSNLQNSGRRRFSKRGSNRLMSEINVTPFVDVMLVLLIIFMVAAPLLTVGVEIELPKTSAKALPTEKEEPLTLSLTKDKELYLQDTKIEFSELIPKLKQIAEQRNDNRIFIRADGANNYSTIMEIMGALNSSNFSNISLVTESGGSTY